MLRRASFSAVFLVALAPFALAACGEEGGPSKTAHDLSPSTTPAGQAAAGPVQPVTQLKRAEVRRTITGGVGMVLQNFTMEDWPVMHDGKFYGWKMKTISPDWAVDLRPGDVVTKINGVVPEKPEDADAALRSLDKAASLKVDFERDGKPRTLELPIVD